MEYFRFWNSKKVLKREEKEKRGSRKTKITKGIVFQEKSTVFVRLAEASVHRCFLRCSQHFAIITWKHQCWSLKTPEGDRRRIQQKEIWHKCKIYPIWYNIAKDSVLLKKAAKMLGFVFSLKRVNYVIPMRNWWYKRADYVDCFKQLYIYPMKHNNLVIVRHLM